MVNDAALPVWFSTTKAVFASGRELGESARMGPALVGLMLMTPSIPLSEADCVCPDETPAHMMQNVRVTGIFQNRTSQSTNPTSPRSRMTKPAMIKPANSVNTSLFGVRSFLGRRHPLASALAEPAHLLFPCSFCCLPLTTDSLRRNFSLSARNL